MFKKFDIALSLVVYLILSISYFFIINLIFIMQVCVHLCKIMLIIHKYL